jgi:hypothetical protein
VLFSEGQKLHFLNVIARVAFSKDYKIFFLENTFFFKKCGSVSLVLHVSARLLFFSFLQFLFLLSRSFRSILFASQTCMTRTIYTKPLLLRSNPILMQILIRSKVVSYDSSLFIQARKYTLFSSLSEHSQSFCCSSYPIPRTETMNDVVRMLLLPHRICNPNGEY